MFDAPDVFVERRAQPLCAVPEMRKGSQPTDGGNFIISDSEYEDFCRNEPASRAYIKPFFGAEEFINGKMRYCLWLEDIDPHVLKKMPSVLARVQAVKEFRLSSKKAATRKWADTPTLFTENRQPKTNYIAIPEVSSERRRYIPMGFLTHDIICSNLVFIIPNATLYHFGVLTSNVHMAWMRLVCGRLGNGYRYSNTVVYNNFVWPEASEEQKQKIEQTAQGILDARALYPDSSLADLYDELTMPPELRKAHQENDRAVMRAYGFDIKTMTETTCVAALMKLYREKAKDEGRRLL